MALAPAIQTGPPSLKLRQLGAGCAIAAYDYKELPATEDDGSPKLTRKGAQAVNVVVSGFYVGGNAVMRNSDGMDVPVEPGADCSLWFGGKRWWNYIEASKRIGVPLDLGDILVVQFASSEPPANPMHSPTQIWSVDYRKPTTPEEVAMAQRAVAKRAELDARPISPAPAPAPAPPASYTQAAPAAAPGYGAPAMGAPMPAASYVPSQPYTPGVDEPF